MSSIAYYEDNAILLQVLEPMVPADAQGLRRWN
jgi:hypothetical protein